MVVAAYDFFLIHLSYQKVAFAGYIQLDKIALRGKTAAMQKQLSAVII